MSTLNEKFGEDLVVTKKRLEETRMLVNKEIAGALKLIWNSFILWKRNSNHWKVWILSLLLYNQSLLTNLIPFSSQINDSFHSRGQQQCKIIGTKASFYIRKKRSNSLRIDLGQQHGPCITGHQYGRRDIVWQYSIRVTCNMSVTCFPTPKCTIYLILAAIFLKLCSVPEDGGSSFGIKW